MPRPDALDLFKGRRLAAMIVSYLHMTNNRVFQDNARLQELVVYDMLSKGVKSVKARQKYQKSNSPKRKPSAGAP